MPNALVVGGTGPTGPAVVGGLRDRGYEVSIFHRGHHEVDLGPDVRHIHGDPHFPGTITEALRSESFDVVIAQYGRLRHLIEHFRGRARHFVAIGGVWGGLARPTANGWGPMGRPHVIHEDRVPLEDDPTAASFAFRVASARRELRKAHETGAFLATYIAYPPVYGPRQPLSTEWSIVRRLLDGRRCFLLPDGGLKLESRVFAPNAAQAPLLAIDNPEIAAGREYVVSDNQVLTARQRIEYIARYLDCSLELIDVPYRLAPPARAFYRGRRESRICCSHLVRDELGYSETYTAEEGLALTTEWLLSQSPEARDELELRLGDPFEYETEDLLIDRCRAWFGDAPVTDTWEEFSQPHPYPHPREPSPAPEERS